MNNVFNGKLVFGGCVDGGCRDGRCVHRAVSENANIRAERKGEGMAVVGGHAGRGGAGQRHRQAYDLFIQRFPALAMAVSFDTFSLWVDEALEEMRKLLKENKTVRELVKG